VVDLQAPNFETRVAIIRKKLELEQIQFPDELAYFIANRVRSNIRQLEGALTRVISYSSLMGYPLSVPLAESVLEDVLAHEEELSVSTDTIQKVVAEHFDVRVADLKGNRKPKNIAQPRMIAMYLCREMTEFSLQDIGDAFGGRDHSTIIHGHKTVQARIQADPKFKMVIATLRKKVEKP
jgi:chromosomal replication initiator protein